MVAIATFFYVDIFSKSSVGIFASLLLFSTLGVISCLNLSRGIIFSIIYAIIVIEFPRDILDVYSALQVENTIQYNVLNSVKIGPFTLFLYLVFLNTFLVLLKSFKVKFNTSNILLVLSFFVVGILSMLRIIYLNGSLFYPGLIITDVKFSVFLFFGIIQGAYLFEQGKFRDLTDLIMAVPIIIGARAILFVLHDSLTGTSNLDLMTQPYLSLAVLVVLIINGSWGLYKNILFRALLFISLLNPSRGFFLLAAIFILAALTWKFYKKLPFNVSFIFQIVLVITVVFGGIFIFNERMFNFFMWKLNVFREFFSEDVAVSGSGMVRYLELANVFELINDSFYELFFGRGFAGTYHFLNYPIDSVGVIDLKSYSQDQLDSGVYYTAHSFFTTILLKYGIFGLIVYLLIPLRVFLFFVLKKRYLLIAVFSIVLIYLYYSRIEYMLLMGLFLGSMHKKRTYV